MKEKADLARKQGVRACLWLGKKAKAKKCMTKYCAGMGTSKKKGPKVGWLSIFSTTGWLSIFRGHDKKKGPKVGWLSIFSTTG